LYGIYRLEGDTLTVCLAEPNAERPKEFKTSEESKTTMLTLKKK
jgi:hypothetical protein